jgi:hypothetical protein
MAKRRHHSGGVAHLKKARKGRRKGHSKKSAIKA